MIAIGSTFASMRRAAYAPVLFAQTRTTRWRYKTLWNLKVGTFFRGVVRETAVEGPLAARLRTKTWPDAVHSIIDPSVPRATSYDTVSQLFHKSTSRTHLDSGELFPDSPH